MKNAERENVALGRFLSKILRHSPEIIGIKTDENGWVNTQELIDGIKNTGRRFSFEKLEEIVNTNNKKRYSFNADKTKIRANQGHSIPVDVGMEIRKPPSPLYHGTSLKNLESIKRLGILRMNRLYVHLSADTETAFAVGKRHGGKTAVLVIDAAAMSRDGYVFRISQNGVWQSDDIPFKYVAEILEK